MILKKTSRRVENQLRTDWDSTKLRETTTCNARTSTQEIHIHTVVEVVSAGCKLTGAVGRLSPVVKLVSGTDAGPTPYNVMHAHMCANKDN